MKIKNIWALLLAITYAILCCIILVMCIIDKRPKKLFDVFLWDFLAYISYTYIAMKKAQSLNRL